MRFKGMIIEATESHEKFFVERTDNRIEIYDEKGLDPDENGCWIGFDVAQVPSIIEALQMLIKED